MDEFNAIDTDLRDLDELDEYADLLASFDDDADDDDGEGRDW